MERFVLSFSNEAARRGREWETEAASFGETDGAMETATALGGGDVGGEDGGGVGDVPFAGSAV